MFKKLTDKLYPYCTDECKYKDYCQSIFPCSNYEEKQLEEENQRLQIGL